MTTTEPAAFFLPGRTYRMGEAPYTPPEGLLLFRVDHITRHPDRGQRRALGWLRSQAPGAGWHGYYQDEDEFAQWTEVSDEPAPGDGLSPTLAALRDAIADPRPAELAEALADARALLAAHARELADDHIEPAIRADRDRYPVGHPRREGAHHHRGGMMAARRILDRYADDLDTAAADGGPQ